MSPPSQASIDTAQALGRLEGGMDAVRSLIASLTSTLETDRAEAARLRQSNADKLAAIDEAVTALRKDMDMVKPLAEKWRRWQYVGLGALLTIGAIGSIIGAGFQFFQAKILAILHAGP